MTKHLSPAVRIGKARTALLLDHPFFGSLLFRLGAKVAHSIETMATGGVSIFYNPDSVEGLTSAELAGVLAHEVMHPALQHHTRRGNRNLRRWNMACDYAINPLLLEAGLTLPRGVLMEEQYRGMSAEAIYNRIASEESQQQNDQPAKSTDASGGEQEPPQPEVGKGNPAVRSAPSTPGGFGQVLDAPVPGTGQGEKTVAEQARL